MPTKTSSLPIYMQTAEMLIREVSSGRLIDGEKLPPERDMATDLGIAVGTLRKALDDLEDKGFLQRIQGSGNYVRHNPVAAGIYAFFRLERLDGGGLPTANILSTKRLKKPRDLPKFGQSEDGHRVRRLRLLSDLPSAIEEIWLDGKWAQTIRPADLSESLYYFYQRSLGLLISRVEDRIGVGTLPDWSPDDIGCEPGDTVGFIERWGRAADGEVVEYSRTWFNPDRVRYVARIK
ncbi:GntR family transcriptional regulator [Rhodobacteraceae bacterium]|nr:GntR family transcriptional regulator [Paracoccaceae bacterium]